MAENELTSRFPDLTPIKSAPGLSTINTIGTSIYGKRDYDEETGTYVTTRCFCVLFMPLIAMDAYRVADAEGGSWYFLGRVPLSSFAKRWNLGFITCLLLGIGWLSWSAYYHGENAVAARDLAEARTLAQSGKLGAAATKYHKLIASRSPQTNVALREFNDLIKGPLQKASGSEAVNVFRLALAVKQSGVHAPEVVADGLKWASSHKESDPIATLELLDLLAAAAEEKNEIQEQRLEVLGLVVAKEPHNLTHISEYALLLEAKEKWADCERILLPVQGQLADTEGARILGRILFRKGKLDEAATLMEPYVKGGLPRLKAAETTFEQTITRRQDMIVQELRQGNAEGFAYDHWDRANADIKSRMVNEYVNRRMGNDPEIQAALTARAKEARVIPTALDLAIASLQKSQQAADPEARQTQLKKAEQQFLEISQYAGESDEYRLSYGQVCYWLGKSAQGKKHFDDLLQAHNRDPKVLAAVGQVLREIGEETDARKLTEEAHSKSKEVPVKQALASSRAVMAEDEQDRLAWLEKADKSDTHVAIQLHNCKGRILLNEGKDSDAARELRQALDLIQKLPEDAGALNLRALSMYYLFQATADDTLLPKIMDVMDRAVGLAPRNTILIGNAGGLILESSFRDLMGNEIDFSVLREPARLNYSAYLFRDEATMKQLYDKLRAHKGVQQSLAYFDKLLILAPKRDVAYLMKLYFLSLAADQAGLEELLARIRTAGVDSSVRQKQAVETQQGKRDDELKKTLHATLKRGEETIKRTREKKGLTLAIALSQQAQHQCELYDLGESLNIDGTVDLAREAYELSPSSGTLDTLQHALALRLQLKLVQKNEEFAQLVKRVKRSMSPQDTLAWAFATNLALKSVAQGEPDLQALLKLMHEDFGRFPRGSISHWALVRSFEPDTAEQWAKQIRADNVNAVKREIAMLLTPFQASTVLAQHWSLVLQGKEGEGRALLERAQSQGVLLPALPK